MYEFIRETRHQRWNDGNGPWALNRWFYEHLGLALAGLVVLAVTVTLWDGELGFLDLLRVFGLVVVPYSVLRLEARAYREWQDSEVEAAS